MTVVLCTLLKSSNKAVSTHIRLEQASRRPTAQSFSYGMPSVIIHLNGKQLKLAPKVTVLWSELQSKLFVWSLCLSLPLSKQHPFHSLPFQSIRRITFHCRQFPSNNFRIIPLLHSYRRRRRHLHPHRRRRCRSSSSSLSTSTTVEAKTSECEMLSQKFRFV